MRGTGSDKRTRVRSALSKLSHGHVYYTSCSTDVVAITNDPRLLLLYCTSELHSISSSHPVTAEHHTILDFIEMVNGIQSCQNRAYNAIVCDMRVASEGKDEFYVHLNCSANKGHGRWSRTPWQRHVDVSHSDTCGAQRLLDLWTNAYRTAEKIAPFYNHKSVRTSFRKRTRLWVRFCFRLNNVLTLKLHGTYELSGCEWYCSRMRF